MLLRKRVMHGVLMVAASTMAHASPALAEASRLYAPCVVCHQANAGGSADGNIPSLAGQQSRYLEEQLVVFQSGVRGGMAMQIVAAHSTISDGRSRMVLAEYLSGLAANANPVMGAGDHLRVGQEIYAHICAACHGSDGLGQSANRVPRLAGQHYPYLRRQIEAAAGLHKDMAPPEMTSALRGMRNAEKDALADYISRLGSSGNPLESASLGWSGRDAGP